METRLSKKKEQVKSWIHLVFISRQTSTCGTSHSSSQSKIQSVWTVNEWFLISPRPVVQLQVGDTVLYWPSSGAAVLQDVSIQSECFCMLIKSFFQPDVSDGSLLVWPAWFKPFHSADPLSLINRDRRCWCWCWCWFLLSARLQNPPAV